MEEHVEKLTDLVGFEPKQDQNSADVAMAATIKKF